LAHLFK